MKIKFGLLVLAFLSALTPVSAQRKLKKVAPGEASKNRLAEIYADSLLMCRQRIDSMKMDSGDSRYAQLFTPLTFYHGPAARMLRLKPQNGVKDSLGTMLDQTLMEVYLKRPDLVRNTESHLKEVGAPLAAQSKPKKNHPDIVEQVAPKAIEVDAAPMDIVITRPNFWTIGGDYYLQFLQNYVSDNWYKGGESNYSMVGQVTLAANYNNKSGVQLENILELKLGFQTSPSDTVHKFKTNNDLIRYTGRLGLQATKKWYYTLQLLAYTQFTRGYKSNDKKVYSDFMSPFNLNVGLGMTYNLSAFDGKLTGKVNLSPFSYNWKYIDRSDLCAHYGIGDHHSMDDFGSQVTSEIAWKLSNIMLWKSRFYFYTTYSRTEMEWENTFRLTLSKYISTNIFVYPRFDDSVGRDKDLGYWQFREYCSLGLSYAF